MIHAITRSLVLTSGAGTSMFGPDHVEDLRRIPARQALEFAVREHGRIADHAALGATERDVDDGAFPGHPGSEGAHFIERHVWGVANTAFAWPAHD